MRLLQLLLLCLIPLLSSCIDGEEEIWLEKDGSGRLEATYKMPPSIMAQLGGAEVMVKKLGAADKKDDSITMTKLEHRVEGGRVVLEFAAEFDDLRELAKFPKRHLRAAGASEKPSSEEALFGKIALRLNGLKMSIFREVDLGPILPEAATSNPGFLGESTFRYTFHLPVVAAKHDAHETSNGGKTLSWSFLLRNHTDAPMTIWAEAPLPIPWWIWCSGVLLVALFLLLVVWAVKRSIAKRA